MLRAVLSLFSRPVRGSSCAFRTSLRRSQAFRQTLHRQQQHAHADQECHAQQQLIVGDKHIAGLGILFADYITEHPVIAVEGLIGQVAAHALIVHNDAAAASLLEILLHLLQRALGELHLPVCVKEIPIRPVGIGSSAAHNGAVRRHDKGVSLSVIDIGKQQIAQRSHVIGSAQHGGNLAVPPDRHRQNHLIVPIHRTGKGIAQGPLAAQRGFKIGPAFYLGRNPIAGMPGSVRQNQHGPPKGIRG